MYPSRTEFVAAVPPRALFDGAQLIRAAGLSLNVICQQVPEHDVQGLVTGGTELTCLFLDPAGEAIRAREREESYVPGHLTNLTQLNIDILSRTRDRLPGDCRDRLRIAVYDETIRFNLILVDDHACVAQPYLPAARGLDSPTLLIRRASAAGGLYPVFDQVFQALAERSKFL